MIIIPQNPAGNKIIFEIRHQKFYGGLHSRKKRE